MKNTRFKDKIRIDPKQLDWVRNHKYPYATMAGFLDKIINDYKKRHVDKTKKGNQK